MVESMLNIRLFSKFLTSEENNIDFFTRWYSGFYRMAWLPKMFAGVNTSTNPGSGRHTGVEGGDGDENNCHQWSGGPSGHYRLWHWLWQHKWGVGWNQHLHISSFNCVHRYLEKNLPSISPLLRAKLLMSHLSRWLCPLFCPRVEILIRWLLQAVTDETKV